MNWLSFSTRYIPAKVFWERLRILKENSIKYAVVRKDVKGIIHDFVYLRKKDSLRANQLFEIHCPMRYIGAVNQ